MIDPKNLVSLTGGLIEDPEFLGGGKVIRLRIAVDFAGADKSNPDNKTGYFGGVHFVSDDQGSKFIQSQISAGNLKKGSQVQVVGRLQHQRFKTQDGKNASNVEIIVEGLTYASGGRKTETTGGGSGGEYTQSATIPDEF